MQEVIEKRTRSSKTYSLGGRKFSWDGTIGSIHYEDNGWQEIDNIFESALAPWDWQMLKAGYHIRVKDDFTAGQIIEFEVQGETVQLQPMALEWTNDLDQIQLISMPQNVAPIITNPVVDLLPAVGVPSHQGTIRWNDAYGQGIDFEWKCTSTRLVKTLEIENLNNLPVPEQYILDGGNPVLRLNLIFDPPSKQNVDIVVDGEVWNRTSKKQTFNIIEFRKDGEVLWGFMPLRYWGSSEDDAGQSVATLEKRGNKLYISIRVPYTWLQTATFPVFIDTDIDPQPAQVGASTDDCFARPSRIGGDNFFSLTDSSFSAGWNTTIYHMASGARFLAIDIVQGDTIDVAYLTIKSKTSAAGTVVRTNIIGEDADTAVTFSNLSNYEGRPRTAVVPWDNIPAWSVDEESADTTSPSIVSIIQTIVDRGGWSTLNDLVLFWEDDGSDSSSKRDGHSYNSDAAKAPKLHIEYTSGITYLLAGVTKDKDGNIKANCECFLCKDNLDDTASFVAYAQSDGSGNYSFAGIRDNDAQYFVISWKDNTPHIFDVTDHVLQPVEE